MTPARSLGRSDREALEKLVLETGAFSAAETEVAMQVFDEAFPPDEGDGDPDYIFLGAFDPTDPARLFGYVCFGPTLGTDRETGKNFLILFIRPSGSLGQKSGMFKLSPSVKYRK